MIAAVAMPMVISIRPGAVGVKTMVAATDQGGERDDLQPTKIERAHHAVGERQQRDEAGDQAESRPAP